MGMIGSREIARWVKCLGVKALRPEFHPQTVWRSQERQQVPGSPELGIKRQPSCWLAILAELEFQVQ